ncbi:MAG: hypothetical protein LBV23_04100 [Deltaproteobacteria bacterium]|jgi:hypothetical protein|nr:hypothetical protein [Deltaproteobacteria bacterium]
MSDNYFDSSTISEEEARQALEDPVKGSLRVLKLLGKQIDVYQTQLTNGADKLEVKNPFEQVAAQTALEGFLAEMKSLGIETRDIKIVKPKAAFK